MKVHEFRNKLKESLDSALHGEKVTIERGGVQYELKAVGVVGTPLESPPVDYSKNVSVGPVQEKPRKSQKPVTQLLKEIPSLARAADIKPRCSGNHYMSREDCGRVGCPWA